MLVEERIHALLAGQAGAHLKAYETEGMALQKPTLGPMSGWAFSGRSARGGRRRAWPRRGGGSRSPGGGR